MLVVAVYSAVYCDKADAQLRESHFGIHTHLQVVAAKPRKVLDYHAVDAAIFNVGNHTLEIRTVEICTGIAIVRWCQARNKNKM